MSRVFTLAEVRDRLKEQADEYRREAGEARRRGEQRGWEKLTAAANVVLAVKEIAFELDDPTQSPEAHAVDVLRRFMCCPAGREMVEKDLLRPFRLTAVPVTPENHPASQGEERER